MRKFLCFLTLLFILSPGLSVSAPSKRFKLDPRFDPGPELPVIKYKPEQEKARFELFNNCIPIDILIEKLDRNARKIGLTKKSIQNAVESRLRTARLYNAKGWAYLYININVIKPAFHVSTSFHKRVRDVMSGHFSNALTWNIGTTGTGSATYILSTLSEHVDEFLAEFLRVNEKACNKRLK